MISSSPLAKPIPSANLSKSPLVFLESRSGKNHSVTASPHRTLIAFFCSWKGTGVHEEGIHAKSGKTIVKVDPGYFRPAEVEYVPFQQTV